MDSTALVKSKSNSPTQLYWQ